MVQPWETYRFIQTTPSVKMPETFTHFRKLPPEIRLMIWQEALPDSRVFEVLDSPCAKQKTAPHVGLMFANVHNEPPPSLAAACQESRDFVLRHYQPLTLSGTTKYLDLSRDVLLLEPYLLVKRLLRTLHFLQQIPQIRDKISSLALGTSYGVYIGICHPILSWKVSKNNVAKLLERLARFPRLRSLVFIVHQDFRFEFDFRYPPSSILSCSPPGQGMYSYPALAADSSYSSHSSSYSNFGPAHGDNYKTPPPHALPTPSPSPSPQRQPAILPQHAHSSSLQQRHQQRHHHHNQQQQQSSPTSSPQQTPSHPHLAPRPPQASTTSSQPQQLLHPHLAPPPRTLTAGSQPQSFPHPPPHPHQHPHPNLPSHSLPLHRPQLVHQAYRFKFDIETNINHHPYRRHHVNELLYYPLAITAEEKEEEERLLHLGLPGYENLSQEEEEEEEEEQEEEDPEWSDPWPTNDDWRRFRRRFQRAVNTTVAQDKGLREKLKGGLPPRVQGASLLWRYLGEGIW